MSDPLRRLDPTTLKALAHPLRVRILDALDILGSANSTALARRLGESTGSTSYHLRELARHGLVVDDDTRGVGRERWWTVPPGGFTLKGFDHEGTADAPAAKVLVGETNRGRARRVQRWLDTIDEWPSEWKETSLDIEYKLRLTAEELRGCVTELRRVLDRFRGLHHPGEPGTEPVAVQLYAFPQSPE